MLVSFLAIGIALILVGFEEERPDYDWYLCLAIGTATFLVTLVRFSPERLEVILRQLGIVIYKQ